MQAVALYYECLLCPFHSANPADIIAHFNNHDSVKQLVKEHADAELANASTCRTRGTGLINICNAVLSGACSAAASHKLNTSVYNVIRIDTRHGYIDADNIAALTADISDIYKSTRDLYMGCAGHVFSSARRESQQRMKNIKLAIAYHVALHAQKDEHESFLQFYKLSVTDNTDVSQWINNIVIPYTYKNHQVLVRCNIVDDCDVSRVGVQIIIDEE